MNSASDKFPDKTAITIFASGAGSNAENLMQYFREHKTIYINLLVTNNADAGAVKIAGNYQIPVEVITGKDLADSDHMLKLLHKFATQYIVLAGFVRLLPQKLVKVYAGKIINIHPALLPKYGGRGMYGKAVHRAVFANADRETGITIHEVNEHYDEGRIIFQKRISLDENDDADMIEQKVRSLEKEYLPKVIEDFIIRSS